MSAPYKTANGRPAQQSLLLWHNGEFRSWEDSGTSLVAHALHYGTGVFEGIRCYDTPRGPAVFRLEDHLRRLKRGAEHLAMDVDLPAMTEATLELLRQNGLREAYVRPIAWYGGGGLALDVDPLELHQAVAVMPWKSHLGDTEEQGVALKVSPWRRVRAAALPPLKFTGVYVNSIIAKLDAVRSGFQEALFVDDDGFVCEATGENVFMVRDGEVVAVAHDDALPGITRDTVAGLADAERRRVHLSELLAADEVFLTGTSAEVAPVTNLNGRSMPVGPVTRQLAAAYQATVHAREGSAHDWWSFV